MESVQGRGGGRRCFLWVLGLSFLSSLSSLLPLSLLASVGAFVVGCGCAQGGGMLWVGDVCALLFLFFFFWSALCESEGV